MEKTTNKGIETDFFAEKSLSLLNVRELRDMGRKLGVPSPTTKSKKDLIDYILKIVYGEVESSERSVRGRPNVREFDMNKYVLKVKRNSVVSADSLKLSLGDDFLNMKVASPTEEYESIEKIEQRVFIEDDGRFLLRVHAFIESAEDVEVSEMFVKKFNLENLDVVETIIGSNSIKIVSINGVKVDFSPEDLIVNGKFIKTGKSNIFYLSTKEEINDEIVELQKVCNNNKLKLYIFSNETIDENSNNVVLFNTSDNGSQVYKKLVYFASLCEKGIVDNEQIVVVINRGDLIDKSFISLEDDVLDRIKKHLRDSFEKIMSLGNALIVYKLEENVNY